MGRSRECVVYSHEYLFWDENVLGAVPDVRGAQYSAHWNQPDIKRRCLSLLHRSGCFGDGFLRLEDRKIPSVATKEELLLVHDVDYIEKLSSLVGWGDAGEEAFYSPQSFEIASRTAKMTIEAAAQSCEKREISYVLTGCPGHHAEAGRARGFCLLNSLALAVASRLALDERSRFIIFDFDAHAPNGTQSIFSGNPRVLVISFHQSGCYPYDADTGVYTGRATQTGNGSIHNIINLPLPPGSGHGAYVYAIEKILIPAVTRFGRCQGLFVSAGFDAGYTDPLARMNLGSISFHFFGQVISQLAHEFCQDTILCFHEGGYSPAHVPFCCLAFLEGLCGFHNPQNITDPFQDELDRMGPHNNDLQPHQLTLIDQLAKQSSQRTPPL